jgi:hypothetical protein
LAIGTINETASTFEFDNQSYSITGSGFLAPQLHLKSGDTLIATAAPLGSFYTNIITLQEVGPEGNNGVFAYTPTANQPGFVTDFTVHYNSSATAPFRNRVRLVWCWRDLGLRLSNSRASALDGAACPEQKLGTSSNLKPSGDFS